MTDAIQAPRPGPDDTNAPDEQKKVHRTETKTRTPVEAKREGPTLEMVKSDERVKVFIRSANQQTGAIGYTEHGERHANTSADGARFILKSLGHDARRSEIKVSRKEKLITLELAVDTEVSPIMEYFEIFLPRMMLSRRAAEFLHCNFALVINNTRLL